MNLPHSKSESYKLFDAIAGRYDVINTILSGGLHHFWRKALRRRLPAEPNQRVLDLATGTADVARELIKDPKVSRIFGIDLSRGMIDEGRVKVRKLRLDSRIELEVGDAQKLSFTDQQFHVTTVSFGIRNMPDVSACLREMHRVLKPGGRCLILEFALPRSRVIRQFHLFYLRHLLPIIGRILSGHGTAYRYLNQTIEEFPYGQAFVKLIDDVGFVNAGFKPLTFGIVNLYWGDKAK